MKTKILLASFCLLTISSFSQDSVFQLKDYKYRTKYRALELATSFSGQTNDYKPGSLPAQKNSEFNLYLSHINYANILSTDKRFHSSLISLFPSFRSHVEKDGIEKTKGTEYQGGVTWSFEDRFYRKNNWFLHLANNLYAKEDFTKQENTQSDIKTTVPGVDESLFFGFGKGRVEMVQDAQMALFILNDLKNQGLIAALASAELVNEFAQLVTEINNRRVFDSRKKRIYELTQIDKFLREKGIAPTTDIRYFTTINDNWALAFSPDRQSGGSWSVNVKSSAELGKSKQTTVGTNLKTINQNETRFLGTGPSVSYDNHKPVNLKWQRDFETSLSWQIGRLQQKSKYVAGNTILENNLNTDQQIAEFNAYYGIGFYPNNRTLLNATLGINAFNVKYKSGMVQNQFTMHPSFNFSTDYFISYKTRLNASVNLLYAYYHTRSTSTIFNTVNSFQTNFSFGISHYLL